MRNWILVLFVCLIPVAAYAQWGGFFGFCAAKSAEIQRLEARVQELEAQMSEPVLHCGSMACKTWNGWQWGTCMGNSCQVMSFEASLVGE